eukprot:NODE_43_length_33755_cov_1.178542.p21 type:complete len:243 gc:universal NODE_43_length_33755_cov_1.178542:19096-18368(-)
MPVKGKKMSKPLSLNISQVKSEKPVEKSYVEESLETPIEVIPHLFLGSSKIAENPQLLKKHRINAILNVAKEVQTPTDGFYEGPKSAPETQDEKLCAFELPTFSFPKPSLAVQAILESGGPQGRRPSTILNELDESAFENSTIEYAKFNWSHYQDNFIEYLNVAFSFIEKQRRKNKNVMIHCQCGVSRSASVVIAYIMYDQKISFQEALLLVKKKSPTANPHLGFICQLIEFEKHILMDNKL